MGRGSKVRIESDGTPVGTVVLIDGKPCEGVAEVVWRCGPGIDHLCAASITFEDVEVVIEGRGTQQ